MAEKLVHTRIKSYSDTDGLGPVQSWDDGVDTVTVKLPAGKKFSRYSFYNESVLGGSAVTHTPSRDATGNLVFKIKWNYLLMGKAQYRLYVYAKDRNEPNQPLVINYGSPGWEHQAYAAIAQGIPFKIILKGLDAALLGNALKQHLGRSAKEIRQSYKNQSDSVQHKEPVTAIAITAAVVFGVIAIVGFVTLAYVMHEAIERKQCPDATLKNNGPNPIGTELTINVKKC